MADGEENSEMTADIEEQKIVKRKPTIKKIVKKKVKKHVVKEAKIKEEKTSHVKATPSIESESLVDNAVQPVFSGGVVLALALLVGILFYNQVQLFELSTFAGLSTSPVQFSNVLPSSGGTGTLSLSESDKVAYGPALL